MDLTTTLPLSSSPFFSHNDTTTTATTAADAAVAAITGLLFPSTADHHDPYNNYSSSSSKATLAGHITSATTAAATTTTTAATTPTVASMLQELVTTVTDHLLDAYLNNNNSSTSFYATDNDTGVVGGGGGGTGRDWTTTTTISSAHDANHTTTTDYITYVANGTGATTAAGSNASSKVIRPYVPGEKYIVTTVFVVGIVLNVLNLLVLTERCLKESPYTYLTAMAVMCLCSLAMSLVSLVLHEAFPGNYYATVYTFKLYAPCVNICSNSTMWLTATLTIERFLFVRHPLWARAKCNRRSAKMNICVIIVLMMILNIPRFMVFKVVPTQKQPGHFHYESTDFRKSQAFVVISWIYSAAIQFIPMTILCIFNFYLVYAVHRARRLRKRMQIRNNMEAAWSREQTRLTITLISIVFFFVICIMPSAFSDVHVAYALFGGNRTIDEMRHSQDYLILQKVANLLVFFQLAFNFLLYSAFNDKFLAVFKKMLARWAATLKRRLSLGGSDGEDTSSMLRLMRLEGSTGSNRGGGGAGGGGGGGREGGGCGGGKGGGGGGGGGGSGKERNGHAYTGNWSNSMSSNRSSNNSVSSGSKDMSQTKASLLEMPS